MHLVLGARTGGCDIGIRGQPQTWIVGKGRQAPHAEVDLLSERMLPFREKHRAGELGLDRTGLVVSDSTPDVRRREQRQGMRAIEQLCARARARP